MNLSNAGGFIVCELQGILNQKAPRSGRALPEVSSTTEEPKIQRGQLIPKQFLGASTKRFQQVDQELNRLGIKPYKLERRTTVPEYNRLYKALLGVIVGVSRLSDNYLIAKVAEWYVEILSLIHI